MRIVDFYPDIRLFVRMDSSAVVICEAAGDHRIVDPDIRVFSRYTQAPAVAVAERFLFCAAAGNGHGVQRQLGIRFDVDPSSSVRACAAGQRASFCAVCCICLLASVGRVVNIDGMPGLISSVDRERRVVFHADEFSVLLPLVAFCSVSVEEMSLHVKGRPAASGDHELLIEGCVLRSVLVFGHLNGDCFVFIIVLQIVNQTVEVRIGLVIQLACLTGSISMLHQVRQKDAPHSEHQNHCCSFDTFTHSAESSCFFIVKGCCLAYATAASFRSSTLISPK